MLQAIKTERKPLKYEEAFQNMKYMKNTMEKPSSYYLSDPPLPDEDLQPTKDSKEVGILLCSCSFARFLFFS